MVPSPDAAISVVVPVYNEPERLSACLQHLRAQLYPPTELIVSDDGSDDREVEKVARFYDAIYVAEERHVLPDGSPTRHMGRAINVGAELATGDILVTLQQDHLVAPDYFLWLVRCLSPDMVMLGLIDHIPQPPPDFLPSLIRGLHLPDGHHRYDVYLNQGRSTLLDIWDWRSTDALDSAHYRVYWMPCDLSYPPASHVWMDHMLQLQLRGLHFVLNPLMRLWHWDHSQRYTGDWEEEMRQSEEIFKQKWGALAFESQVAFLHNNYREQRLEFQRRQETGP